MIQFYFILEVTLTLIGNGQEAGSLVVQLLDITTRASQTAIDDARDNIEQALPPSPPIPETVQDVIVSAAAVQDLGGGIMNSLKQVVDKTKIVVDFVDKVAQVRIAMGPKLEERCTDVHGKLHPYANVAWQVLSSAYKVRACP